MLVPLTPSPCVTIVSRASIREQRTDPHERGEPHTDVRTSEDTSRKRKTRTPRKPTGLKSYLLFYQIQCDSRHQTNTLLHAKPAEKGEDMRGMNGTLSVRTVHV